MKQAHIFVSGRVQGVFFRAFVKESAEGLGIKGWVRNTFDGRVEAVLQGSKESVGKLIVLCRKGPELSEVEKIDAEWEKANESYSSFEIM